MLVEEGELVRETFLQLQKKKKKKNQEVSEWKLVLYK